MYNRTNVNSIIENVTQIKNGITINVDVSKKIRKTMRVKEIIFEIVLRLLVKIPNILELLLIIESFCMMKL